MPDKKVEIEIFEDENGEFPDFDTLPISDQVKFIKKNEDFEKFTYSQFSKSKFINPAEGYKGFYEIRYLFSSPPYRGIALVYGVKIIILSVFKGSGSNGHLSRHMTKAVARADKWKSKK